MVHVPLYVSDKFKGKSGAGLFGDVMMEVGSVGQIMKALRKYKLEKDTLFVFTSDNGLGSTVVTMQVPPLRSGRARARCSTVAAGNRPWLGGPGPYPRIPCAKNRP